MPKPQYGHEHQAARRAALASFTDGQRCPICTRPMRVWESLDLHHVIAVARGGTEGPTALAHSYCNRKDGGLIGNRSPKRKRKRNGFPRMGSSYVNRNGTPRIGKAPKYRGGNGRVVPDDHLPKW